MDPDGAHGSALRRLLHPLLPAHYSNPLQLAGRVLGSGEQAAWFAAASAALTVVMVPLDMLLQPAEQRARRRHPEPQRPTIIVCGPPRSGTTIVALTLIRCLPVTYVTNLMAIFPRSPATASRLFGLRPDRTHVDLDNYYGRTAGFRRHNDALPIWDRWLGADRTLVADALDVDAQDDLRGLFGLLEARAGGRPVVAKNNGVNAVAHLVAKALPDAVFLCMDRDPVFLAQSLLQARRQIHGSGRIPYGLHRGTRHADPVDDVASQVRWLVDVARRQEERLGANFWRVPYEAFCADPADLIARVASRLGVQALVDAEVPALRPSRRVTLDDAEFIRLEHTVQEALR